MYYAGVDYHKSFSYCTVLDEKGKKLLQSKFNNSENEVMNLLKRYQPCKSVMEACWNWPTMHGWLAKVSREVYLAHPLKVKAIASAKVKTDKIDSAVLAHLLRTDLLPTAHIPSMDTYQARQIIRQRLFFVKTKTAVKNRIKILIERCGLKPPTKNPFCQKGIAWLRKVSLPEKDWQILNNDLSLLIFLKKSVASSDQLIKNLALEHPEISLLRTIPGLGPFFSVLVFFEIDGIKRFPHPKKLHAYAGLVPSTHQSGNKLYHGRLTKEGNKYLRYSLIEAVYPAIRKDPSLKDYYQRIKERKGANPAKVATARRLLTIVYQVLKNKRSFWVGGSRHTLACH
jgi:transposase